MTEAPALLTYLSVVSRESVRIAFTVAALNDLDVLVADIGNAYLNADCCEKVYTIAGPEFGSHAEKPYCDHKNIVWIEKLRCCVESAFSKHNDRLELYTMSS